MCVIIVLFIVNCWKFRFLVYVSGFYVDRMSFWKYDCSGWNESVWLRRVGGIMRFLRSGR